MRLHVNMTVSDIEEAVRFYSILFGTKPVLIKEDYAKWELTDPTLHFAVSIHGSKPGVDHLGLQLDNLDQLKEITGSVSSFRLPMLEQENTACCYARSNKTWLTDSTGLAWEVFHTFEQTSAYGDTTRLDAQRQENATPEPCCDRSPAGLEKV